MSAVQCLIDRDAAREDWLQREGSCPVKSTLLSWDQLRTANWRHRRHTTTYIDNIIIITNCSSCKLLSLYVYSLAWVFLSRLLVALKRAGCVGVSSKKSQFCLTRCSKWCPFAFSYAYNCVLHWSTVYRKTHYALRHFQCCYLF